MNHYGFQKSLRVLQVRKGVISLLTLLGYPTLLINFASLSWVPFYIRSLNSDCMDFIFLSETELPVVQLANERYRFRSDLFVSKPHFTSKKPNSRKIDYEEELRELVKSSRFINFAAEFITYEDPSRIPSSDISSNRFLESTEKEFRKQPIFSLDKVSTRIDYPDFLVNRLITTSKASDVKLEIKGESFLLPKNSSFIICDIKESAKT